MGSATARFTLSAPGPARLTLHDVLGRTVAVALDGALGAGAHAAVFDGAGLPSGAYLVRLEAGGHITTRRLTLVR